MTLSQSQGSCSNKLLFITRQQQLLKVGRVLQTSIGLNILHNYVFFYVLFEWNLRVLAGQ